jgi:hypothetical protein
MRLIVSGDRNWKDPFPIRASLSTLLHYCGLPFTVIEGECPYGGVDKITAEWAEQHRKHGVEHVAMPAHWTRLRKAAGPERNGRMLAKLLSYDDPDKLVYAFHSNLMMSRGTLDMVEKAEKIPNLPIWVFDGKGEPVERTNRQQQVF